MVYLNSYPVLAAFGRKLNIPKNRLKVLLLCMMIEPVLVATHNRNSFVIMVVVPQVASTSFCSNVLRYLKRLFQYNRHNDHSILLQSRSEHPPHRCHLYSKMVFSGALAPLQPFLVSRPRSAISYMSSAIHQRQILACNSDWVIPSNKLQVRRRCIALPNWCSALYVRYD